VAALTERLPVGLVEEALAPTSAVREFVVDDRRADNEA
jgi:hypothetical protein